MIRTKLTLFLLLIGLASSTIGQTVYEIGSIVSDFSLKSTENTMISMENYEDANGIILAFTCNTCPWAKLYESRLIELHNEFAPKGYPVIAINPNDPKVQPGDSFEAMQERKADKEFPFAYVVDENQVITRMYGATRTPELVVLQKNEENQLVVAYKGAVDDSPRDASAVKKPYVATAINALMKGEKVETTSTKAIGCSIKWSPS